MNRGADYADGKIIYNTLDAHTVASMPRPENWCGRPRWATRSRRNHHWRSPGREKCCPHGNERRRIGRAAADHGIDLKTGKIIWRPLSSGSDADVRIGPDFKAFYAKDQGKNLGLTSWTPGQWKRGGGTIWGRLSYDPR